MDRFRDRVLKRKSEREREFNSHAESRKHGGKILEREMETEYFVFSRTSPKRLITGEGK